MVIELVSWSTRREREGKCELSRKFIQFGQKFAFYELSEFRNIKHSNRLDLVAQLVEHWTSKPKVAGSIPTVVRLIFQLAWCGIYTQSNNTLHILHLST